LTASRGWNLMRNCGTNEDHRAALDTYTEGASAAGHARSGANFVVERFIAIGEADAEADRNLDRRATSLGRIESLYAAGGGREVPSQDGEFQVAPGPKPGRPALAISGTPDQIVEQLQQVIDETGARRILVETFSHDEARLL